MNKEYRMSKEAGASRHILTVKKTAPSARQPSTFDVRNSIFNILFFPFLLHSFKVIFLYVPFLLTPFFFFLFVSEISPKANKLPIPTSFSLPGEHFNPGNPLIRQILVQTLFFIRLRAWPGHHDEPP
jgi:hypothetical protein